MRIRSRVKLATMEFFEKHGFTQFDAPELTGSAPEGTTGQTVMERRGKA